MINKKFIQKLKKEHSRSDSERRQIISLSNVVLHGSKRIIFALHRGDLKKAENSFKELEKILKKLEKNFGFNRINEEGAYKAALEEYAEAKFFYFVLLGEKIGPIKEIKIKYDSYLGGLCDLTGELVRLAINKAAGGQLSEVGRLNKIINDVVAELVEFDMVGYLRTKYDQAKNNLRKIEQINYEINMKK